MQLLFHAFLEKNTVSYSIFHHIQSQSVSLNFQQSKIHSSILNTTCNLLRFKKMLLHIFSNLVQFYILYLVFLIVFN